MKSSNIKKALSTFGKNVVKDSKKNLDRRKANSSGRLRKSIEYKVTPDEKGIELALLMEAYGVLLDAGQLGHNRKILKGWNKSIFIPRGKGYTNKFPDIRAIREWIRQKPVNSDISPEQLTFLVSRKIFREGITPRLFMSDAFNKHRNKLDETLIEALGKDIDDFIE